MNAQTPPTGNKDPNSYIDIAFRLAFLGLVAVWCFLIFKPFVLILTWSVIISVALYPLYRRVLKLMRGKKILAALLIVLVGIILIVLPSYRFVGSIIENGKQLMSKVDEGTLRIEQPDPGVRDWPLIGSTVYSTWLAASQNLEQVIVEHRDTVGKVAGWLLRALAGMGKDIFLSVISFLLAGLLLVQSDSAYKGVEAFFDRIIGRKGTMYGARARDTMRSVIKGVIFIAVIQAVLAWIGFAVVELPAAGIWAVVVLLCAIIQLPVLIVLIPLAIYVFSYAPTTWAIVFAVWCAIVAASDAIIKPFLLGKGLDTPMLVILVGALGGMVLHGILGLFIGAVVLALGYDLYKLWLHEWRPIANDVPDPLE